ncbi:MAG: hypothetical protein DCC68_04290 [Planctomycetota bacterium]|nr:MAG: hypothetical protein DCC68_04290 [Planctomycetota bacterium]
MTVIKYIALVVAALVVSVACEDRAMAQFGGPSLSNNWRDLAYRRPTVSPYLSLFDRAGSSTTPYYAYVKPRLEQQAENRRFEQQQTQLRQELNQVTARANAAQQTGRLPTGHTTAFMNYSHYFRMPR